MLRFGIIKYNINKIEVSNILEGIWNVYNNNYYLEYIYCF